MLMCSEISVVIYALLHVWPVEPGIVLVCSDVSIVIYALLYV